MSCQHVMWLSRHLLLTSRMSGDTDDVSGAGGLAARWKARRARAAARRADAQQSEPVVVAIFHTEVEARLAAGHLRSAGIPAGVTLDYLGGEASGIVEAARLHVARRNREDAQSALADTLPES